MDLCGPMRVASINGKKYILVIVDDYSRFTWLKFLASKDEAPDFIIKFLMMIQVRLNTHVRNIRTDNGTEFVNQTLRSYFESVGISHETSLLHDRKPDLSYLYAFGALCYPNNDSEDLGKLQAKADKGIFIVYAPKKKAYRIYIRRTKKIIETIHVDFDELTAMASEQLGSGLGLQLMTPATSSSRLVPQPIPQQSCIPPPRDDWDCLFHPMFNEYFNPPTIVVSPVPIAAAPKAVDLADSLVSMSIDQDAPSTSIPSTQEQEYSSIISQGFEESPKMPHFLDDPIHKSLHKDLTYQGSSSNVRPIHTLFESLVKPKNFKQAMTEPSWIDAMQEEIHEFERLQVWELVSCPDKAIRIFVANAANKKMTIFQMDVKTAFLNGELKEEVQFIPTLFTRKVGNDLLLVQIYIDDIIFASTNTALYNEFANLMTTKFKMSMMGQMSFFLGLQISQSPKGIFLNQSKYAYEIIKKYGLLTSDSVDTPMVEKSNLDKDLQGKPVDATLYRGMIRSLMYLTSNYGFQFNKIPMYCDKESAITLCCNNVQHSKSKHIDVRYHFIKEHVENGIVKLYFVRTKYQLADIFTKPLPRERFNFLIKNLGMRSMSPEMLKRLTEEEDKIMTSKAQQIELDSALVALENHRVIGKCNMRINPGMKPKESTYLVVLDALALTICYPAFLITTEVPRFFVNVEVFRDILNICPRIPGQEFDEPPTEEEDLSFIQELGHAGEIKYITNVIVDHLHQPWRTFASIINKCLCGKDLAYQIDNIDSKKQDKMFYPRFTKIIIHHFFEKDKSISMRNRMFMHTARDDSLLGIMRFVSRHADTQVYGVILPKAMTNQAMLDSVAYKTYYAITSGAEPPKLKKPKTKSDLAISSEETPSKKKPTKAKKDVPSKKKPAFKPKPTKNKAPVKADRGKGLNVLSEVAVSEAAQLKEATKQSKKDFHISQASGPGDGTDFESVVPNEQHHKTSSADERIDDDKNDDDEETNSDRTELDRIKIPVLNQSITEYYEEEEEKIDDEEKMDEEEDDEVTKELYKDVNVNLGSVDAEMTNVDQGGADQQNVSQESVYEQEEEDDHVTLTTVHDTQKTDETMKSSSVSSDFTSKLLNLENPSPADNEIASLMDNTVRHEEPGSQTSHLYTVRIMAVPEITSVFTTTIPPPPPFFNPLPQQATPTPTPTASETTTSFPSLLDFASVFKFNKRVTNLEKDLSEMKQVDNMLKLTPPFTLLEEAQAEKRDYIELILPQAVSDFATHVIEKNVTESLEDAVLTRYSSQPKSTYEAAASLYEFELTKILIDKMEKNKSYDKVDYKRELYDALVKSYQTNKDLFDTYGEVFTLKRSRDDKDKDQDPSAGSDRWTKSRKSSKEAESSRDSRSKEKKSSSTSKDASYSQHKPSGKSAHAEEPSYTVNDSGVQQNQEFNTSNYDEQPSDKEVSKADWLKKPERPPTHDPDWN
ncbi:retrovirus-related pol polyprotein from transposon TNT 1-94 [Tanacetum coccineum]